jgi:ankyrin repeat protein
MKLSRQAFWGLSILLLGGLPLLITGGLIYRGDRQQIVDRALITAIKKNDLKRVTALLAKGADPNARDWPPYVEFVGNSPWGGRMNPSDPQTALMVALGLNGENIPLVKTLLDAGASLEAPDEYGRTALTCAAAVSKRESVRFLIARGADVNAGDHGGDTPLHAAASQKDIVIVHLLLDRGARANARDSEGVFPIHNAAYAGQADIVALLLAHKGAVNARDSNGSAPIDYAARGGSMKCVAALKRRALWSC